MSAGLSTLLALRRRAAEEAERGFARRLAELREASAALDRASERLRSHRTVMRSAEEARCQVVAVEAPRPGAAGALTLLRHEARLRTEEQALRFGEVLGRREVARRTDAREAALRSLAEARARTGVVESLLEARAREERRRQSRRAEAALDDYSSSRNSSL